MTDQIEEEVVEAEETVEQVEESNVSGDLI